MIVRIRILEILLFNEYEGRRINKDIRESDEWILERRRYILSFKVQQLIVLNVREINRMKLKIGYWIWYLGFW